tara:strand:+ start:199 stop:522 length:324 start_codon:yes stop_codon:yes gene_type:complete
MLSSWELSHAKNRGLFRLSFCDTCPGGKACQGFKMNPLLSGWKKCPEDMRRALPWQFAISLFNQKQISPLSNWPSGWAAWVVDMLEALERAQSEKMRAEMKRHTKGI